MTEMPTTEKVDATDVYRANGAVAIVDALNGAVATPGPKWKTPAERALTLGEYHERLTFTVAALNKATRGGLPAGKVVAIGGPPGGGKTSLVVQEALAWVRAGVPVCILAADEDADGLLIRIGQQLGFDRELLESGDQFTRLQLSEELKKLPALMLVDAEEEEGATVESVAAELAIRRGDGQLAVLVLDSIQTVIPTEDPANRPPRDVRERVDNVVKLMKRLARRSKLVIIATSEVSRGSYNTEDKNKRTSPLAAFKESGGIEYGVALAMVLAKFKEEGEEGIDVIVAKNRLGSHADLPTVRLKMTASSASFDEISTPTDDERDAREHAKDEALRQKILNIIEKAPVPLTSKTKIWQRTKGMKGSTSKPKWMEIIGDLDDEGLIEKTGPKGGYVVVHR